MAKTENSPIPTYLANPFVAENAFIGMKPRIRPLPRFSGAKKLLPKPFWAGHKDVIRCYWKAWEIAFRNLRRPARGSGFVSPFIDTAFNGNLFMWDSAFILMFGKYGERAFHFQGTLDNFYSHQHPDGFISREIREKDGVERFERADNSSTGPNIMPWSEWEYYLNFGDRKRLSLVFPALVAYYQWTRANRTWPSGAYWSSGYGCGMDNQPRFSGERLFPYGKDRQFHCFSHGHMSWVDITLQQVFSARLLLRMARVLKRENDIPDIRRELGRLEDFVNRRMWDPGAGYYFDLNAGGKTTGVKSVAAFWALLAGVAAGTRLKKLVSHLRNPREFNRPHRVPSLSADPPDYRPGGRYWMGGVWAPTTYMVFRGLTGSGEDDLAHEIAVNHLDNVVRVFRDTGTLWENYAPERAAHGDYSCMPDFVGWTGLAPVSVLFEYVFGIRPEVPENRLAWDVRLLEEHGVSDYPFGKNGLISLCCAKRKGQKDKPDIRVKSNRPITLSLKWAGGEETLRVRP